MRIGLFGRGRFGSAILDAAQGRDDLRIAWAVDRGETPDGAVDVAIDASVAEAVEEHLDWALRQGTALVVCATGWNIPELHSRVGDRIGLLTASNCSLTVALMTRLALVLGRYAQLDPARDLYILEHHHRAKADAPSGTAKTLAAAVMKGCPRKTEWSLDSALPHQLNVGVLRSGSEPGRHTVGLDALSETLAVTHHARSRQPFAEGALAAALWIRGRKGLYTMDHVSATLLDPLFDLGVNP